jgi:2-methylisocitrate lyase-like PEP mutase family enzyme
MSGARNEKAAAGVKRISLATSLYRAAMSGLVGAARRIQEDGRFDFLDRSVTTAKLYELMRI